MKERNRKADGGADRGLREIEVETDFCPAHAAAREFNGTGSDFLLAIVMCETHAVQRLSALTLAPATPPWFGSNDTGSGVPIAPKADANSPQWHRSAFMDRIDPRDRSWLEGLFG